MKRYTPPNWEDIGDSEKLYPELEQDSGLLESIADFWVWILSALFLVNKKDDTK